MQLAAETNPTDLSGPNASLRDLLDVGSVEDVLSSFYALFQVPIRLLDQEGRDRGEERARQREELGRGAQARRQRPGVGVVSRAPSSATITASRLAGSVSLAFSLTRCSLPGGSKKLSPAL